jgi:hypothetical protein
MHYAGGQSTDIEINQNAARAGRVSRTRFFRLQSEPSRAASE